MSLCGLCITGACDVIASDVMSVRIKCPGYEVCKHWFTQRKAWRAHANCCCHAQMWAIRRTDKNGKVPDSFYSLLFSPLLSVWVRKFVSY